MPALADSERRQMAAFIADRGIHRLVHFSPRRNLIGMFQLGGLWARGRLIEYAKAHQDADMMAYVTWNDSVRLDGRQDCINLSVERINAFLFDVFKRKFEERFGDEEPWCVIEINPSVMLKEGVVFTKANAASSFVRSSGTASGLAGLQSLYENKIVVPKRYKVQVDERTADLPRACPTSVQAEVMVPREIPLSDVIGLVFNDEDDMLQVKAMLGIQFPSLRLPPMRVSAEEFRGVSLQGGGK